jgi:hypothetical protein
VTADELRAWMARLKLTRATAADALGISKRTIDAYVRPTDPKPIPRPIELLCRYVEDDRRDIRRQLTADQVRNALRMGSAD